MLHVIAKYGIERALLIEASNWLLTAVVDMPRPDERLKKASDTVKAVLYKQDHDWHGAKSDLMAIEEEQDGKRVATVARLALEIMKAVEAGTTRWGRVDLEALHHHLEEAAKFFLQLKDLMWTSSTP